MSSFLANLVSDLRYAGRGMRTQPGFTAVAILTLALGIGANTAIFSIAYAVLLRPLPYTEAGRLVAIANQWEGRASAPLSDPEYLDYAERSRTVDVAAVTMEPVNVSGGGGDAERLMAGVATANALDVLGVRPALGRPFRLEEEQPGRSNVVLLSHEFWQRRFAADTQIAGRTLTVNGVPHDIAGVLPAGFLLPIEFGSEDRAQIVLPLELDRAAARSKRGAHYLSGFARIRPGADLSTARADMNGVITGLIREYPDQHDQQGGFRLAVTPLRTELLGDARPVVFVLAGAVALVLLIACANVANLLMARGEARRRELAIRAALGASRLRVVRQLLTESGMFSAAGAAAGLLIALWCQRVVVAFAPSALPRVTDTALNGPVVACAAVLALSAALLFGLVPAMQISRTDVNDPLKDGARGSGGHARTRTLLVIAQVAIAVVLLVGAGLLVKSFARLMAVPSGFSSDHVLTLRISLPEARYPGRPEVTTYFERLLERVASLPGVESAGAATGLPMAVGSGDWSFDVEGRPPVNNKHSGAADWYGVTPGYFETLGIRVVRGRSVLPGDTASAPQVLLINETTARTLFPSADPVGKRVRFSRSRGFEQPWRTIVGVVADVRQRGLDAPPRPEAFFPHAQFQHFVPNAQARSMNVVIKTSVEPGMLTAAVGAQVRGLDPEVPGAQLHDMNWIVESSTRDRRLNVILIGTFGVLALVLAAVGLYGVMAFQVAQRSREMGIRLALGASPRGLLGLVLSDALRLVAFGLAGGLIAALALGSSMTSLLFDVTPRDLSVFAAAPAVLLAVALFAAYIPARRAMRVDPMVALRAD